MEGTSVEETTQVEPSTPLDYNPLWEEALEKRLEFLYGKEVFTPGLSRIERALKLFDLYQTGPSPFIVTIAGTNGKGETCMRLAGYLKNAGVSYALWTSPHVLSLRERFQTEKGQITYKELTGLIEEFQIKLAANELKLSYFEFLFLIFLAWSKIRIPSVLILEVGLGGRFDAVNVLDANLTAIVSISRDHEEILGQGYRKILCEKWGITRKGVPLLTTFDLDYLQDQARERSKKDQIPWRDLIREGRVLKKDSYSTRNRALSRELYLQVTKNLHVPPRAGVWDERELKARGEVWNWGEGKLIFYGPHNPDGLRQFIEHWKKQERSVDGIVFAFSKRSLKDLKVMCALIQELPGPKWGTTFEHMKAANIKDLLPPYGYVEDWKKLLEASQSRKHTLLITGSYYFVGLVQSYVAAFKK